MANLFDVANAPTTEPERFTIGDFVQWKREDIVGDYPVATHSATWIARLASGTSTEITVNATEASTYYLFTIASADSASFSEGHYHWQLEITETSSGNRLVIERGEFEAIPDLDVNQSDPRTHADIMLAKIETILEGKADSDVGSYSIAGRSLTKMSFDELMVARDRYKREVLQHQREELIKRGKASANTVKVRFS